MNQKTKTMVVAIGGIKFNRPNIFNFKKPAFLRAFLAKLTVTSDSP